jgi:heptosyltransferase-2
MGKILIIKMGYSETLESRLSLTSNLGDVLRTTFILNYFKQDEVTWLVDLSAYPLLAGNKYIDRIVKYNRAAKEFLKKDKFDLVINLEKVPEICSFLKDLKYNKLLGFSSQDGDKKLIEISRDFDSKKNNRLCFQEILAGAIKKNWREEPYILGYDPITKPVYDIGFNWTASRKWSNKAWPQKHWKELETLLDSGYTISWQKGFSNLYEYIEWINGCRIIVSADTLGLHIALALKKRVVALFGPTVPQEIFLYNRGSFLTPEIERECIPCCRPYCQKGDPCINKIYPEQIKEKIDHEFKQISCSRGV